MKGQWLSVKEAAERLGLSAKAVYDLVSGGVIPCRRVGLKGGKIVLDPADIQSYWDSCKGETKKSDPTMALRHVRRQSPSRRPS